jgi:type II secretory pathway component PulF
MIITYLTQQAQTWSDDRTTEEKRIALISAVLRPIIVLVVGFIVTLFM